MLHLQFIIEEPRILRSLSLAQSYWIARILRGVKRGVNGFNIIKFQIKAFMDFSLDEWNKRLSNSMGKVGDSANLDGHENKTKMTDLDPKYLK